MKLETASLNVLWWGVSIGGRHYTGDITLHNPFRKTEMVRKLGRKEAKELSEREGRAWLRRQTETNKFNTREQLERHAVKWCAANLGADWVLFDGNEHNPSRVVGAAGWVEPAVPAMNALAAFWDTVPDSRRSKADPSIDLLYRLWYALLKPPQDSPCAPPPGA